MRQFWYYYEHLLEYSLVQTEGQAEWLEAKFDRVFQPKEEYEQLDAQIRKVKANKVHLLLVLKNPKLPLHHNPAELGARQRVRKLDVSRQCSLKQTWLPGTASRLLWNGQESGGQHLRILIRPDKQKEAFTEPGEFDNGKGQAGDYSYYPSEKSQKASQTRREKQGDGDRKGEVSALVIPSTQPPPRVIATPETKPQPEIRTVPLKQALTF